MWFFGNKVVLFCGRPFEVNPTDFIVHDWCIKKKRARIEKKKNNKTEKDWYVITL